MKNQKNINYTNSLGMINDNYSFEWRSRSILISFFVAILVLSSTNIPSQNLVPNGSFEEITDCNAPLLLELSEPWFNPSAGSPDLYSACSYFSGYSVPAHAQGFQYAYEGDAIVRILLYHSSSTVGNEYIEVPLINSLVTNVEYQVEFQMTLSKWSAYTSDDIGCYFSNDSVFGYDYATALPLEPQVINEIYNYPDTSSWTLFSGVYIADGGENFLTIGNFLEKSETNLQWAIEDTLDLFFLSGVTVYIDDVSVTEIPVSVFENRKDNIDFRIYPNPFKDELKIESMKPAQYEVFLMDELGRMIKHHFFLDKITFNLNGLDDGIYLYEIRNDVEVLKRGKVVKE